MNKNTTPCPVCQRGDGQRVRYGYDVTSCNMECTCGGWGHTTADLHRPCIDLIESGAIWSRKRPGDDVIHIKEVA